MDKTYNITNKYKWNIYEVKKKIQYEVTYFYNDVKYKGAKEVV